MTSVDTNERFWGLKADTSASTSPASSPGPSPTAEEFASGTGIKAPLLNNWHLPDDAGFGDKFTLGGEDFDNDFSNTTSQLSQDVAPANSTPPTLVPSPPPSKGFSAMRFGASPVEASDPVPLPASAAFRDRSTSISFKPTVTLDCGGERKLDEPLPKLERLQTSFPTGRPSGRALMQAFSGFPGSSRGLSRAQSESERTNYSTTTGELLGANTRAWAGGKEKSRGRHPLLQSTVDALARDPAVDDHERVASLTSDSTASAVIDEIVTPPSDTPVEFTLSPMMSSMTLPQPTSLEDTSAWPISRISTESSSAKSFNIPRPGGLRRGRRTFDRRSSSQASTFLSTWGSPAVAVVDPDSEGQEVFEYVIGKQIGFGGFSVVKEAFTIEDGHQVTRAVKIVRKHVLGRTDRENEQAQTAFEHEVSIWRTLHHENILPLSVVYDTPFATYCFMPMNIGGSLYDLIRARRSGLPPAMAKRYAFQLASALRYLHEDVRIVHRDVKLENCLLDTSDPTSVDGKILLCDFGMAQYINPENSSVVAENSLARPSMSGESHGLSSHITTTTSSIDGSLQYACPEVIMGHSTSSNPTAVDMWAFGIVVYALVVGKLPFQHTFLPRLQMMILKGDWDEEALRDSCGHEVVDLVKGCLDMNPETRWSVAQVLDCKWLRGCAEAKAEEEVSMGAWL